LGSVLYACDDPNCRHRHWAGRSCGNRHCPNCQHDKTARWLKKQTDRLLPVHHFLVTFTVPKELRSVLRRHQRRGYRAIFQAGSGTIRHLAAKPKWLGTSKLGFFGVLHTWGRDPMVYHPHVHFVVPGGGVAEDGSRWLATPENFLFYAPVAQRVYKAKLADELRACGLYDAVPAKAWRGKWVVNIKPVGNGHAVLKYLAPYVHRIALSNKRIIACDARSVTYRYTPSGQRRSKTRTVEGHKFLRGFLQHVLPRGFHKVRYYGWMSPNHRLSVDAVRWLVWLFLAGTYYLKAAALPEADEPYRGPACPRCGGTMHVVYVTHRPDRALPEHGIAYLDSG